MLCLGGDALHEEMVHVQAKIHSNSFGNEVNRSLGKMLSNFNHDVQPQAFVAQREIAGQGLPISTVIGYLIAGSDIQSGKEITISYGEPYARQLNSGHDPLRQ